MKPPIRWSITITLLILTLLATALLVQAQTPVTIEPGSLSTDQGGTISIYATGTLTFTASHTARLVGYGILPSTYINPTALQAIVPAGLDAGSYAVSVLDGGGSEVGAGTLALVAPATPTATPNPTATPKPASSPPPGRPILTVRNYTVEPAQVKPNQEFTISVEVYNNGSRAGENTMAVFPGGTFVPLGDKGHLFWQVHINHTFVATQKFRVPAEINSGIHQLHVDLSANDWEGNHYDYPTTIPVEVIGGKGSEPVYTGKPELVIEGSETSPTIVAPGDPFTLTLNLANRGSRTATNVMVNADTNVVIPIVGSGVVTTDVIRIDQVVTLTIPLQLKNSIEGGKQGMAVSLACSDYSGGSHAAQQTVGLHVDTSLAKRPQILLSDYQTEPAEISPGDTFTLTLQVDNVGGGDAQRLTLALGGEEGAQLGAFIPIKGSNVSFLAELAAGESQTIVQRMLVAGNAETRAHSLPIALAYDTSGTRETDTQRVSLMVQRRPQFKLSFYRPVPGGMVGQPLMLPIEVINTGTASFHIPELAASSDALEFLGETSTYVGQLAPDGSWTLDAEAVPLEAGSVDVVVSVEYVDDLNHTQVYSDVLIIDVADKPPEPVIPEGEFPGDGDETQPESLGDKIWRFVKGLLGLGS